MILYPPTIENNMATLGSAAQEGNNYSGLLIVSLGKCPKGFVESTTPIDMIQPFRAPSRTARGEGLCGGVTMKSRVEQQ